MNFLLVTLSQHEFDGLCVYVEHKSILFSLSLKKEMKISSALNLIVSSFPFSPLGGVSYINGGNTFFCSQRAN